MAENRPSDHVTTGGNVRQIGVEIMLKSAEKLQKFSYTTATFRLRKNYLLKASGVNASAIRGTESNNLIILPIHSHKLGPNGPIVGASSQQCFLVPKSFYGLALVLSKSQVSNTRPVWLH